MPVIGKREQKLKYYGEYCTIETYNNGLELWRDIDYYFRGFECRNRVIIRIDAIQLLTDLFSKDILSRYRSLIWNIAAGITTDVNFISQTLISLMKSDEVFADKLREFYYCRDLNVSFGEYILTTIADAILAVEVKYRAYFRGMEESVYCLSGGYLYISIPDSDNYIHLPDKGLKVEVVSVAKNWSGLIK